MENLQTPSPSLALSRFTLEELFFSRTDERGVIKAGNEVFARVSEYSIEDMLGAPHKIIRHPEMPKGMFWLMWDRIKRNIPTGAYVRNSTKSGADYWVFAVITPQDDGYLSVRLMPTSELFEKIREVYADLLAEERAGDLTPEASAKKLMSILRAHGYRDYDAFMAEALVLEHEARSSGLNRTVDADLAHLTRIAERCEEIGRLCDAIFGARDIIAISPVNLSIIAAGFKTDGRPLAVISENFGTVTGDLVRKLEAFQKAASACREAAVTARFLDASSSLQGEMAQILKEGAEGTQDHNSIDVLDGQRKREIAEKGECLGNISRLGGELAKMCEEVRRILSALSVVRVACKIESAALNGGDSGVESMVTELQKFEEEADGHLGKILRQSTALKEDISSMQSRRLGQAA